MCVFFIKKSLEIPGKKNKKKWRNMYGVDKADRRAYNQARRESRSFLFNFFVCSAVNEYGFLIILTLFKISI